MGELVLSITAAGYILGRKELPKLSHFVGQYVGRSVGAIVRAKQEFFDATKDSEIVKVSSTIHCRDAVWKCRYRKRNMDS